MSFQKVISPVSVFVNDQILTCNNFLAGPSHTPRTRAETAVIQYLVNTQEPIQMTIEAEIHSQADDVTTTAVSHAVIGLGEAAPSQIENEPPPAPESHGELSCDKQLGEYLHI